MTPRRGKGGAGDAVLEEGRRRTGRRCARRGGAVAVAALLASGCAASRSALQGGFEGGGAPAPAGEKVAVAFLFTHVQQNRGWDVVPKIHEQDRYASGFYELFGNALPILGNVGSYVTFTDHADDVINPARRAQRDSLAVGSHDFTVSMRFFRETSFPRETLGSLVSLASLAAVPIPYTRHYSLTAQVTDRSGRLLKSYQRDASVTQWVQALLIFLYPFHPEKRKTDGIYLEFLRDVFREMEADRVLVKGSG